MGQLQRFSCSTAKISLVLTGNFNFHGTVKAGQNNYAGLGTVDRNTPGALFPDAATGILAQAQHAKAYATAEPLNCPCADPRYSLLVKYGKTAAAQHWEELGGKWAVSGYDTKKYAFLAAVDAAKDSYGYQIIKILEKILAMPKKERGDNTMGKRIIIAIDAGHGMGTAGKRCLKSIDPLETREWYLNDRIADILETKLAAYNCHVLRVDDTTGVKDIPLATRVKTANSANADVYVSIHHNAGLNGRSGGGTVVYYHSAAAERPGQAQSLYNAVTARTSLTGNRSSRIIKNGFYVLRKTKAPAFLIENGFMDSLIDVPVILTSTHAEKTAQGILAFLILEFNLQRKDGTETAESGTAGTQTGTEAEEGATYYPAYTGKKTTLSAAMTSLSLSSSYAFRRQIAAVNGIAFYMGTAAQNTQMYNLLAAGLLKRA